MHTDNVLRNAASRLRALADGPNTMPTLQFNFNDSKRQDGGNPVEMEGLNEEEACGDMLQHFIDKEAGLGEDNGVLEESDIKINKPYKRRRLKLDPVHRLGRQVYKLKKRNPAFKRKQKLYQKKYRQKNKMALKRRSTFVKNAKKRMPKPQPRPHVSYLERSFYVAIAGATFPNKQYDGMRAGPPDINTAPDDSHTVTDFNSSAPYYAYSNIRALVRALVTQVKAMVKDRA
jgi:hypothetical protein